MRPKYSLIAVFVASLLASGQNSSAQSSNQSAERQFELRRENFNTGRQLLLEKGVPFDPDEILHEDWPRNLKNALATIPEMHQSRHETAPLKGAYLADTLYLPEKVQLSGHTVILANYVVFEGRNPVIKGNFDIYFFPAKPVTVLGTTLGEALRKSRALNVKLGNSPAALPSFALMQGTGRQGRYEITFDTSGPEPQALRPVPNKPTPRVQTVSWNMLPAVFSVPDQDCNTGCDKSGGVGTSGANGLPGGQGAPGPNQPKAANGTCAGSTAIDGDNGADGGNGQAGGNGTNGGPGGPGGNARNINATVADGDPNQYNFLANGGVGGIGGNGGNAGQGGNGGRGGDGGDGAACGCTLGEGGDAGKGGDAGRGGNGGNGGPGGIGGTGGTIIVSLPFNSPGATSSSSGGVGGLGGSGGIGETGGVGGIPGNPGNGGSACGSIGPHGQANSAGASGSTGTSSNVGPNGQSGMAGPPPSITFRANPNGGGAGGGPVTCLGGGGDPSGGDGTGGDVGPTCSPILIDTEGEGFHLTSAHTGVMFDISGTGHPVQIAWTDARFHNAFLALPGADGLVHNGKELFGNFTPQPQSNHPNGFLALAQFDKPENGGNGDGVIDDKDSVQFTLE